jgi:hypothetical protein
MSYALLLSTRNPKILFWLAQELRKEIVDFDSYGQDRHLLAFAYRDLETCLKVKWKPANPYELHMLLKKAGENHPEEVKAFLKVWICRWLKKWRERVRLFQEMPRFSKRHLGNIMKAKKIYREMKERRELKKLVVQKLVNQGEVCMTRLIAETIIIEKIAHQLNRRGGKPSTTITLNPAEILQGILSKVKTLTDRKTPIVYIKIMLGNWIYWSSLSL